MAFEDRDLYGGIAGAELSVDKFDHVPSRDELEEKLFGVNGQEEETDA